MMRLFAGELGQEARQKESRIEEITIVDGVVETEETHGEGDTLTGRVGSPFRGGSAYSPPQSVNL